MREREREKERVRERERACVYVHICLEFGVTRKATVTSFSSCAEISQSVAKRCDNVASAQL